MVIAEGVLCRLLTRTKDDWYWYWYWYWLNNGDWRNTDAPWEVILQDDEDSMKAAFYKGVEREESSIKTRVWIESNNKRIGSLNCYAFNKTEKHLLDQIIIA